MGTRNNNNQTIKTQKETNNQIGIKKKIIERSKRNPSQSPIVRTVGLFAVRYDPNLDAARRRRRQRCVQIALADFVAEQIERKDGDENELRLRVDPVENFGAQIVAVNLSSKTESRHDGKL